MNDKRRTASELQIIQVSTLSALRKGDHGRVKVRSDQLLGELESKVLRDGGDPESLAAIETTRRGAVGRSTRIARQ